jgi:hypothetical protein
MSCARARNVWFYDGLTNELLGGVQQNGSITNENFFEMLTSILLVVDTPTTIYSRDTGQQITLNDEPLEKGHYDIFCAGGKYTAEFVENTQVISVVKQNLAVTANKLAM